MSSNQQLDKDVLRKLRLIQSSLEELYVFHELGQAAEAEKKAAYLISKHRLKIRILLSQPYGQSLSPEGLAEMILVEEYMTTGESEASATYMFH